MRRSVRRAATLAAAVISCLGAAACGSSSSSSSSNSQPASSTQSAGVSSSAASADKVYASYSHAITSWPGPNTPVKVTPGKKITIITCGSTGVTCVRVATGAKAAAQYLGYTATVIDGQQNPTVWNTAIHDAISNKSDGIILAAVPPVLVQGALQSARSAGIKVAATLTPNGPGPVTRVNYDRTKVAQANTAFIAKDSGGNAHVLQLADYADFPDLKQDGQAYAGLLKQYCSSCSVVKTLDFTAALAPQRLAGDVAQALQADPSINRILVPFDTFNAFVIQGVRQAGKVGTVKIVGVGADPPSITAIRQGVEVESLGTPAEWMGWSAVDGLLRAWAGTAQLPVIKSSNSNYDVPLKYITNSDVPGASGWQGDFNYQAKYKGLWKK